MKTQNLLINLGVISSLAIAFASTVSQQSNQPPQTIIIKQPQPQPQSPIAGGIPPPALSGVSGTCPAPSEEILRCISQWACQYLIRLDLRCLLNLNGNPLLANVLGGGGTSPATGGTGGILGGILG